MEAKTILIVEDQFDFLAVQKIYLEHHGYRVLTAEDGQAGLRSAREHLPNLILMDFSVPMLDGIGATSELKRDPSTRDIPVIMVSALAYGSIGRRAREAGCAAFVSKPCDPRRVLAEVENIIGASETALH
ncbi:MAG TPA: response regulator [Longimicrobiaceae bacterium]|nr:response regulator [Longimicrobiaceae bacterium]